MKVELNLLPHQQKLLRSAAKKSLLLCGRGAGKSYILAAITLLTLLQGKNVMVGGQRYDTLHDTLYAEIKRMATDWGIYSFIEWREAPMQMRYNGHCVFFATYESVDASRGYSNIQVLLMDELFLAPLHILSVWGPCMRGPEVDKPRIIGATTPRVDSGWNVLMASSDCDWEIIKATTRDNTFITDEQYALILSGITTDEMRRQELDGEILVGNGATSLIRLDEFPLVAATTLDDTIVAGLDCGEGVERDATAFFARRGNTVLDMWKLNGIDHEETVRRIVNFNHKHKIGKLNMDMAFSDYEFNILKYEMPCEQIPFSRHPSEDNREKFANIRAEMMFNFAAQVKRGLCVDGFDLTPELKRQACALSWRKDRQGRLLVTPKDDLRVLLKMSTDILDAAALTCVELTNIDDPVIKTAGNDMDEAEIERIMDEA